MMTPRTKCGALAAALLVAASLPLAPPAMAASDGSTPVNGTGSYLAGRFAQHQDDWRAAAQYMSQALAANPSDLSLLRRAYILKLGEGEVDTALGLAMRLTSQDGEPQLSAVLLIADALKRGRLNEAEEMAKRMPREGLAKFIGPLYDAWLAVARGDTVKAQQALAPLGTASGFAALHNLHMALVLDLGGKPAEAAEYYRRAAGTEPPLRVVQLVGNFLERQGRKDEAKTLYKTFRTGNPESLMIEPALKALEAGKPAKPLIADARQGLGEALFDLGSALHHEGAEETALLFARIALHLRPDLTLARLMIGDIMEAREHHAEALDEYKGLEQDPALGWAVRLRAAESLARLERTDEAIAQFSQLAAERPERTDALVRLGDLYRVAKRYGEAADTYTKALERIGTPEERHWAVFYARALSLDKLDKWPLAEADLKKALELRPDEPYLLNYLGYSWVDRGQNLDRAKAMIERAVELKPRDGYIVDSLGWALYRIGEFEAAVGKLERAVELRPVDSTINDHLGDAYWRVGRRTEARFQWQRALRTAEEEKEKEAISAKMEKGLPEQQAAKAEPPKAQ
ncbi:MAG TPA: tetratricopeptide repeat protein [Azospirillum sp.]|nr:tetratricopeptide repeat protein [Azospirillum sp.]